MKFKSDIEVQSGLKDSSGANGTSGQVLSSNGTTVSWINAGSSVASDVQNQVKAGVAINKGQAVYVTSADGTNIIVGLASNTSEATSSKTLGLLNATVAINGFADVVQIGRLAGLNTIGATVGDPVWLGTNGNLIYGLINKPYAPAHLVYIGVVTRVNANNGEIFVSVQNGFELKEIHDVDIITTTPTNGDVLGYNGTLWVNKTVPGWLGYTPVTDARTLTINGTAYDLTANRSWSVGTVTSVAALTIGASGTDLSSSVATGTTTPVITLNVPTASAANRGALSSTDWSTFNTKVGSVTASSPLASSGGSTPNITIQQSSGSQNGYLSSTDWTTFNSKQASGNYITSLTGEATASGPGAASVTLNNASVTAKVLTGINITGGTVQATDTMLTAFGKLQNQINGLIGSSIYQGTWNASTNTPTLTSSVGTRGYYYIVSVAGTTNLNGITDWFVGDWVIFDGTAWQQVDNTDAVVSVNGQTGAVSLTTDNIAEGATNQYYLNSRARSALSFTAGSGAYNSTTGVITIPTNTSQLTNGSNFITLASLSGTVPIGYNNTTGVISITQSGTASNGYLSSTDWNTFNNKQSALTNPITGTGTTNYIPKFTGSTALGNSLIFDNGTNVGIGTATPLTGGGAAKWLTLEGTTYSGGIIGSVNGVAKFYNYFDNASNTAALQGASGVGVTLWTDSAERMRITSGGNVGIGTTNPDIFSRGYDRVLGLSGSGITKIELNGSSYSGIDFGQAGTRYGEINVSSTNFDLGTVNASPLYFQTNGSYKMAITSGGNVGIGVDSPLGILHTAADGALGQLYLDQYGTAGSNLLLRSARGSKTAPTASQSQDLLGSIGARGYDGSAFSTGGKSGMYMYAAENFTSTAQGSFLLFGTTLIGTTSRTERMRITDAGNLQLDNGELNTPKNFNFLANRTTLGNLGSITWKNVQWDGYIRASIQAVADTALSNGALVFSTGATNSDAVERMRIAANGNVAIGTTSPDNGKLTILKATSNATESSYAIAIQSNASNAYTELLLGADDTVDCGVIQTAGKNTSFTTKKLALQPQGGNVLIGTTTDAGYKLDVNGTARFASAVVGNNTVNTNNTKIQIASTAASNKLGFSGGANNITEENLYVWNFTTGVSAGIYFQSNGTITASGGFFNSDMRLKDLTDYDYNVSDIKPISYLWKDSRDNKKHVGYSAQEVQNVMPDAVNEDADGMLSVNYIEVLVAKIAELENRIKQLEK